MSGLGGKADMIVCGCLLSRSLSGVKRTCLIAAQMSAFDPKRTWAKLFQVLCFVSPVRLCGGGHEATRISRCFDRCGGYVVARGARTASRGYAAHRHYRSCKLHRYEISDSGAGL